MARKPTQRKAAGKQVAKATLPDGLMNAAPVPYPVADTRFRGQSLTVDSVADSRLAFGGSLGRADWGYGRRMGSDRAAAAA